MQRKEELLWRKLSLEVPEINLNTRIRRASTDGTLQLKTSQFHTHNDQDDQISSPTFKKLNSGKQSLKWDENKSFSFGEQMLEQMQILLIKSSAQKNDPRICMQQLDAFSSIDKQRCLSKLEALKFTQKINKFVSSAKLMLENIKLQMKSYQQYLNNQQKCWQNSISLIISKWSSSFQDQNHELKQKIEKVTIQNYFINQKNKLLEKKNCSLQQQISELINSINSQRMNNQRLNITINDLNSQFLTKTQQNTDLIQVNSLLKDQVSKLTENNNNNVFKCRSSYYNNPIDKKNNLQNQETPHKNRQYFLIKQTENKKFTSLLRTPNTPKDYQLGRQTFTTYSIKNDDIFLNYPQNKESYGIYNILKQNQINTIQHPRLFTDEKMLNNKLLANQQNQIRIRRKSTTFSEAPYEMLSSSRESEHRGHDEKTKLLNRIKKLKQDINSEIKDLRLQNY